MLPLLVLLLLLVQVAATSTSAPAFQAPKMLPHGVLRTAHERKAHLKMAEHAADASSLMRGKGIEATHDGLHHSSLKAKQMLDKLDSMGGSHSSSAPHSKSRHGPESTPETVAKLGEGFHKGHGHDHDNAANDRGRQTPGGAGSPLVPAAGEEPHQSAEWRPAKFVYVEEEIRRRRDRERIREDKRELCVEEKRIGESERAEQREIDTNWLSR